MIRFSRARFERLPIRSDTQQTYRYILPVIAAWADGRRYKQVALFFAWWKWQVHFFFSTKE
jgi:hypothetical protein